MAAGKCRDAKERRDSGSTQDEKGGSGTKRIGIAAFTERGRALAQRIAQEQSCEILWYEKNVKQWCAACFAQVDGIIFIGACGIAVRTIAPLLKSKTTDPAVLVVDENGQFVISLLSGHIGGANEFARQIAAQIGAVPVITTASDVSGKIAVDVFAKKNDLTIGSMDAAKKIAAAILRGEDVGVCCDGAIEGEVPPELRLLTKQNVRADSCEKSHPERSVPEKAIRADLLPAQHLIWISASAPTAQELSLCLRDPAGGTVLHLIPRCVVLGLGCRRGKTEEELCSVAEQALAQARIPVSALAMAASIDLKKDEPGILKLCGRYHIPFVTYPAMVLAQVEGDFQSSEFVRQTTGVDNVCERAALLAAGEDGRMIRGKFARNGVTAALALQNRRIRFDK